MARTYLIKGKLTRAQKEQGVNYVEPGGLRDIRRPYRVYNLGWTNGRQSILVQISREVYQTLRSAFR